MSVILVADDDRAIRTVLSRALSREGFDVRTTGNASTLWTWVAAGEGDLVMTDVVMPDENGLDLIPRIKKIRPDLRIVVMSAQNTLLTAVKANERGAFEYLPKPFDLNEVVAVARRALSPSEPVSAGAAGSAIEDRPAVEAEALPLIGRSQAMQETYRTLARLMNTDLTVLINGESGTGKELVARALHDYGRRKSGPFVALNMGAIPRDLIESELFGHEKGAFTGAHSRMPGRFEQAEGGTLFLDEIGDMPLEAQTRLLRVIQEGEYSTVGGSRVIRVNVRLVAATHRNLKLLVSQGRFREDLYYRLNVVPIRLPPLRERAEDIGELARHFFARCAREDGLAPKAMDAAALERLRRHDWPGNVRELENLVRRLCALYPQELIGLDVIEAELAGGPSGATLLSQETRSEAAPADAASGLSESVEQHLRAYFNAHPNGLPPPGLYDRVLREVERPLVSLCLEATRGNQIQAATLLGLNRNTLRKKIKDLDIEVFRSGKA